jgi:beta-aspartyl-peptidase (threonine type)
MKPVVVIHGGAGAVSRGAASPALEPEYHAALQRILASAQAVLAQGGSALDAVSVAVTGLEDCPYFNAGHGAVLTSDATHELDAAIMDGATLRCGSIANVHHVRNPVLLARMVMERSRHVFFVGEGAERFARANGVTMVGRDYFTTPARLEQLRRAQHEAAEDAESDSRGQPIPVGRQTPTADSNEPIDPDRKFGTVGAVALDANGNLAAATSTGGITNKQVGRVGDAPVIGAGTYANNATCAVSCTGTGEMYIRMVAAYDVAARMQYGGATLAEAADAVMFEALPSIGGKGGLIAVDQHGNIALPFNTDRMYRGYARVGEQPVTEIYPT